MAYFKNIDRFGNELIDYYPPQTVQAFKNSSQSIPNLADTTVSGWTNQLDTSNGAWNSTTGVFTANRAGYYRVSGYVVYTNGQTWASSVVVSTHISKNNSRYAVSFTSEEVNHNQHVMTPTVTAVVQLNVGETISLTTWQNSGSAKTLWFQSITTFPNFPFFISINEIV
jgi:hypothetical protein